MKEWTAAEILSGIDELDYNEVEQLGDKLGEILAGKHPGLQGCVLANALATWLMGHDNPKVREELLAAHIDTVRSLLEKG